MTAPLAARMFKANIERCQLSDELGESLEALGVSLDYVDEWVDDYDSSLELGGCDNDMRLTPEQVAGVFDLGFSRVWLNHKDGWETYYYEGGDLSGHRSQKSIR